MTQITIPLFYNRMFLIFPASGLKPGFLFEKAEGLPIWVGKRSRDFGRIKMYIGLLCHLTFRSRSRTQIGNLGGEDIA